MMADRQESEDIVQESFFLAFQKLNQLHDKEAFGGWLRKIVINTCLQRLQKRINFQQLTDNYDDGGATAGGDEQPDPKILNQAIKNLPEGCRQIFLLYVSENFSHAEISAKLNISESTSKSQYARAKKLLKAQLLRNE